MYDIFSIVNVKSFQDYSIDREAYETMQPVEDHAGPPKTVSEPNVRKDFSETFLWTTVDVSKRDRRVHAGRRGSESINVKVPDSITSYIISGVSMHERFGLALPFDLPSLTVFQPFFIQFTLPFSVKRGEKLKQNIFVFNFLNDEQVVTLSVDRQDNEFDFFNSELNEWQSMRKTFLNRKFK